MRRLLLCSALVLVAATAVACSDDAEDPEGAGGGTAGDDSVPSLASSELCEGVEDQLDLLELSVADAADGEDLAAFDELIADAPPVIQDDLQAMRDALVELGDPDVEVDDAVGLIFDPELLGAVEQVGLFLESQCGIEIDTPSDAPSADGAGSGLDATDLRTYLEAEDPALEARIQSVVTVAGLELNVTVRNLDDPVEAVEICEVLSGYAYGEAGDTGATINVQDTGTDELATRDGEEGTCAAT